MERLVVATLVLFVCGYASNVEACSCVGQGPACEAVWRSDVVFVGRVEASASANAVRFTLERRVRGLDASSVDIANGPGNCAYSFKIGERYVVYAHRDPQTNQITTSICTRTRPAEQAVDDLAYFDEMLRPATGARVYGRIRHIDADYSTGTPVDYGPIANVPLTLTAGDNTIRTATDANGHFEFASLNPDTYQVNASLPTTFVPWRSFAVTLPNNRACRHTDNVAQLNGRIRGRILGEDGRPAAGVRVEAASAHAIGEKVPLRTAGAVSNPDGTFEIGPLPAGDYLVGTDFSMRLLPRKLDRRRYYPGVRDHAAAQTVHLDAGARVGLQDFRLPPLPTERKIQIVVLDPEGNLVPGAIVTLYGARPEDHITSDGRISFTLPYGAQYNISGRMTKNGKVIGQSSLSATIDRDDGDGTIELRVRIP